LTAAPHIRSLVPDHDHTHRFAAPAQSTPPPPLLLTGDDICEKWMPAVHADSAGPVCGLGCYVLHEALIGGRFHVAVDGAAIVAPDLTPEYWRHWIADGTASDLPQLLDLPVREVAGEVAVLGTIGYGEYGHWMLDILPRLWTQRGALGGIPPGLRFALPMDTPRFGIALLEQFGIGGDRLVMYDRLAEMLRAQTVVLPSLVHADYRLHPAAAAFYDDAVARFATRADATPQLIYVSRAGYHAAGQAVSRRLANEAQIRAVLESAGFTTVFPEKLPWREQLALFAGARVIVGEHGSAMKNLVFTPKDAVVVNMHFLNLTQTHIAGLRGHHLIYLRTMPSGTTPDGTSMYVADAALLRRCVSVALDKARLP
jgi:capsular polysaccharide biosynthesis protein